MIVKKLNHWNELNGYQIYIHIDWAGTVEFKKKGVAA